MVIGIFLIILFLLLFSGIHIAVALGLTATVLLFIFEGMPISVISQNAFVSVNSYALAAIPFFILAGDVVLEGKLADRLLDFAGLFLRRVQAGLAMAVVVSSVFFAAVSGSSVASAAALGRSVIELLKDEDYPQRFIAGLVAAGSTMGLLIPPSLTFILIGSMQGIPIVDLFTAGILPGLFEGVLTIAACYYLCKKHGWGKPKKGIQSITLLRKTNNHVVNLARGSSANPDPSENKQNIFSLFLSSAGVLLMPPLILGGIYLGFFTPTEVAGVAFGYALLLATVVYRTMAVKKIIPVLRRALRQSAMIYFVVIGGNLVGFMLISLGITDTINEMVAVSGISKWQFLLIINTILLMMGAVLDGISVIVLTVPILFPVAVSLGINPIHFAVILTANVEVATLTPPVGLNLYVMSGVTGLPVAEVARGIGPFYVVQILVLLTATYVPWLSLFLLQWI